MRIRSGAVEWREVDGEIVALDLRTMTYLTLNETGATLWPALVSGADREQLVALLGSAFGVSGAQASADLEAFLDELAAHQLLESD